jgi:hypothetical protein
MLSPKPKTKRFLERIQLVLTFASVCAVVDATFIDVLPHDPMGYHAGAAPQDEARVDRLFGDLARSERKRREAEVREALQQRQLGA